MKKSIVVFLFLALTVVACHTKKEVAKTTSNQPTDAQLAAGKTKFPDLTMDVLKKGHSIYYGACTNCHGPKNITDYSEQDFSGILDKMAPKANLTPKEKEAVLKYAVAIKLSTK